ncbi:NAD(P)-dependent oxidoreductase [Mycolicibacterium goodii]|uniref:NAD(P)-dependent oxidoreductase n=1 Tax=Mycolicibacterium goodii TaxID=134601 RepID=UPI000C26A2E8|nr:NAD(P)-dependent oxidoreductase [Mycolicibacterium goodii]PJK19674.1 6-phosphogluconate dehydrogenase [Mycolicibacterium goodii]
MRIGFIGAGRMGAPMVQRLIGAGHGVHALARTDEKRDVVAALGATPVATAAAAVHDTDIVIVCVFTDEQVRTVCTDDLLDAMASEAVLILHTTGSPRTAEDIAARAASRDVAVVDAPVSGGPHDIAAGSVTVFAGGDADVVERARAALGSYANPVLHVGPIGAGQRVKLINNTLFAAQIGMVAEGVRLAAELGVEESALLTALTHGSAAGRALTGIAATGSAAAFNARVGEFIDKDVAVVRKTAAELGADLGILGDAVDAALRRP